MRLGRLFDREVRVLAANTLWMWAATGARLLMGIVQIGLLTRVLGRSDFGRLTLAMSATQLALLLTSVRVWEWIAKALSEKLQVGDDLGAARVLRFGYLASASSSAIALAVLVLGSSLIATYLLRDPGLGDLVALYACTLLFTWANDTSTATLRVFGEFRLIAALNFGTTLVRFGVLASTLTWVGTLRSVVVVYLVTEALGAAVLFAASARAFRQRFARWWWGLRSPFPAEERASMKETLLLSFWMDTLRSLGNHADIVFLGAVRGPADVALFRVAQQFVDLVNNLAGSLLQAAYASLARLAAKRDAQGLLRLVRRSTVVVLPLVLVAAGGLTLTAPWLVRWTGGAEFVDAVPLLQVYAWSLTWILTFWIIALTMSVGRPRWALGFSVVSQVLKLSLMVPLTLVHGLLGFVVGLALYGVAFVLASMVMAARLRRIILSPSFAGTGGPPDVSA